MKIENWDITLHYWVSDVVQAYYNTLVNVHKHNTKHA